MKSESNYSLTPLASTLLTQLIDVNWEMKEHRENNMASPTYYFDGVALARKYNKIEKSLIEEMGKENYDNFIAMGRKMFGVN